jgi:hypothetical protein
METESSHRNAVFKKIRAIYNVQEFHYFTAVLLENDRIDTLDK